MRNLTENMSEKEAFWQRVAELYYAPVNPEAALHKIICVLEEDLKKDPSSLETRVQLIKYYSRIFFDNNGPNEFLKECEQKLTELALWIMDRFPDAMAMMYEVIPFFDYHCGGASLLKAETIWLKHIAEHPSNPQVLKNAQLFLGLFPGKERELQVKLIECEPEYLQHKLRLFEYDVSALDQVEGQQRQLNATKVFETWNGIEEQTRLEEKENGLTLPLREAARCAYYANKLIKAKELALEFLSTSKFCSQPETGNVEKEQDVINLLGLIALASDSIDEARWWLRRASLIKFPESSLPWMYPEITLAQAFLDLGDVEAVCEFLKHYPGAEVAGRLAVPQAIQGIRKGHITNLANCAGIIEQESKKGRFLVQWGQLDRAKKYLGIIRSKNPDHAEDQFALARLELAVGNVEEALIALRKSILDKPEFAEYLSFPEFDRLRTDTRFINLIS